jgi:acetyl-CoA carboxylase biotin carboxylase subunit
MKRITTVLVANRGEIARRLFRTVRNEGLRCAAVFTEVDRSLPFVNEADVAVCIGEGPAQSSYLHIPTLLAAAERCGADAIHPGYGFLSENAEFARAVERAGLVWIGPSPKAIEVMGDKTQARALAQRHQVKVVPGFDGSQDPAALLAAADAIGYPVLIKAAAGGGGRGMRRVDEAEAFKSAVESASREALSAFGNGAVFLEKFIEHPRHIEVQIIADKQGHTLHLGERECSVQRRHQKIIEEAPCPALDEALRRDLCQAAITMAKAIDYVGAGTVEFIYSPDGQVYFLEMNTRLQVEHTVTEEITGLDLVALQLSVARGEPLPITQDEVRFKGHSIEARIYAEDPSRDYAPGIGPLLRCDWPTGAGVRVDTGVESGDRVSPYYDAMLSKIVVTGQSRRQATERMLAALNDTWVVGPPTNICLLKDVFNSKRWQSGGLETGFLALEGLPQAPPLHFRRGLIAATCLGWWLRQQRTPLSKIVPAGWQVDGPTWQSDRWQSFGKTGWVNYRAVENGLDLKVVTDHERRAVICVRHIAWQQGQLHVEVDGLLVNWRVHIDSGERRPSSTLEDGDRVFVHFGDGEALVQLCPRHPAPQRQAHDPGTLTASTPGTVVKVLAKVGDLVQQGDTLVIIEAMKMEQRLTAPATGTLTAVRVKVGDTVSQDDPLMHMECEES